MLRLALLTTLIVFATGCWNDASNDIHLGDVSIGQQLIDLQRALEAGAIAESEYDTVKANLFSLNTACDRAEDGD